jgi:hypothetical protein
MLIAINALVVVFFIWFCDLLMLSNEFHVLAFMRCIVAFERC